MTVVRLGNPAPQMQRAFPVLDPEGNPVLMEDGQVLHQDRSVPAPHLSVSVTTVEMRPDYDDLEEIERALTTGNDRILTLIGRTIGKDNLKYAIGVLEIEGVMERHSGNPQPDWVASDDKDFEAVLAKHYGCAAGEPLMLLTNAGRDALHAQHLSTSAPPATFNFIAVSESVAAASAANTTLPGEITTAGGGLLRAVATYAHTAGTNTSTLTKTFTGNGSDTYPKAIAKIGVFNAATVGTIAYETLLNAVATLNASGDNVAITETVTMS